MRLVVFNGPQQGPHLAAASSCRTNAQENRAGHVIQYLPWLRHFRIEYRPLQGQGEVEAGMIHESRIMWWEPAPSPPGEPAKGR